MPELGRRMEALFNGDVTLEPVAHSEDLLRRNRLYNAAIRHSCPRFLTRGSTVTFDVEVRNLSDHDWPPTAQSGIAISANLHNIDGWLKGRAVGYARLDDPIKAKSSATLRMDMTVPDQILPMMMRLAMTDEGVCHFLDSKNDYVKHLVILKK
jgi:hypothetical protein